MKKKFNSEDFRNVVLKKTAPPNCDVTLQIEPVLAENGLAKAIWTIDEKFANGIGVIMGGFLTAAADIIMAYAMSSLLNPDQGFVSIDLHTTFHRPVFTGTAEVEAKVERKGARTAYLTAEILQNGKICCSSVSSMMIFENS